MSKIQKFLPLIIGAVVILLVIGGSISLFHTLFGGSKQPTATPAPVKHRITTPVNIIQPTDRPYLELSPKDIHTVTLSVLELKKPATSADFELEYQTGSNLEGAVGAIPVDKVPASKDILLGSCSAGGACTYNTNVQGGTWTINFSGGPDTYALKQDWKYVENKMGDTQFSSRDDYFQIDSENLANQKILIIYNTPGVPKSLTGTAISEAYTLTGLNPLKGTAKLSMRLTQDATNASIMGYDGQTWKEFPTKVADKTATAQVDLMRLYVVVKK